MFGYLILRNWGQESKAPAVSYLIGELAAGLPVKISNCRKAQAGVSAGRKAGGEATGSLISAAGERGFIFFYFSLDYIQKIW